MVALLFQQSPDIFFIHEPHINLPTPGALLLTSQTDNTGIQKNLMNVLLNFIFLHLGGLKSILCTGLSKNAPTFHDFPSLTIS